MKRVDLQMHSTYSDGYKTPTELVEIAAANGVQLLALTDHDGTDGIAEAQEAGARFGVRIVSGIEITTELKKTLHVLGYGFDPDHPAIQAVCTKMRESRKRVFLEKCRLINERLKKEGRKQIDIAAYMETQKGFFGLGKALEYMVASGVMISKEEAVTYWEVTSYVPKHAATPEEAIRALHEAGGASVLSHPLAPKLSLKNITPDAEKQKRLVAELKATGLDGLECYTPCHSSADAELALAWAREFDLLPTVGSDWHGPLERIGEQVRSYIPYYVEKPGDVVAPDGVMQTLYDRFSK